LAVRTPVDCEPLAVLPPDQAPEATHEVAFVEDQVRDELVPLVMVAGLALMVTEGGAAATETVVVCVATPPGPVQVNVYNPMAVRGPVDCEPLNALLPDQAPEAEQDEALLLDQVSVEAAPELMVLGEALSVTVGADAETVTVVD
jgi:hypothetical protein